MKMATKAKVRLDFTRYSLPSEYEEASTSSESSNEVADRTDNDQQDTETENGLYDESSSSSSEGPDQSDESFKGRETSPPVQSSDSGSVEGSNTSSETSTASPEAAADDIKTKLILGEIDDVPIDTQETIAPVESSAGSRGTENQSQKSPAKLKASKHVTVPETDLEETQHSSLSMNGTLTKPKENPKRKLSLVSDSGTKKGTIGTEKPVDVVHNAQDRIQNNSDKAPIAVAAEDDLSSSLPSKKPTKKAKDKTASVIKSAIPKEVKSSEAQDKNVTETGISQEERAELAMQEREKLIKEIRDKITKTEFESMKEKELEKLRKEIVKELHETILPQIEKKERKRLKEDIRQKLIDVEGVDLENEEREKLRGEIQALLRQQEKDLLETKERKKLKKQVKEEYLHAEKAKLHKKDLESKRRSSAASSEKDEAGVNEKRISMLEERFEFLERMLQHHLKTQRNLSVNEEGATSSSESEEEDSGSDKSSQHSSLSDSSESSKSKVQIKSISPVVSSSSSPRRKKIIARKAQDSARNSKRSSSSSKKRGHESASDDEEDNSDSESSIASNKSASQKSSETASSASSSPVQAARKKTTSISTKTKKNSKGDSNDEADVEATNTPAGRKEENGNGKYRRSSAYRGVGKHPTNPDLFRISVSVNGKRIPIGNCSDEEIAAKIHDQEALKLLGDEAKLNFPALRNEIQGQDFMQYLSKPKRGRKKLTTTED